MTVADFLDVLNTKATVSIIQNKNVVLEVKNIGGISEKLSAEIAGAAIESMDITGSTAVSITIEGSAP